MSYTLFGIYLTYTIIHGITLFIYDQSWAFAHTLRNCAMHLGKPWFTITTKTEDFVGRRKIPGFIERFS